MWGVLTDTADVKILVTEVVTEYKNHWALGRGRTADFLCRTACGKY